MAALTTITRPSATPTPSSPVPISNDEITYPHFRLLNRQTRVTLSAIPFQPDAQQSSPLFVISNTRGWFAAVIRQENAFAFITSPLSDLRTAATNGQDSLFAPSRSVPLGDSVPCMIAFALNDSRLVVALASGEILVYDTAQLFTSGQDQVQPVHAFRQAFGAKIRHVLPNPNSTDVSLGSLVAVVLEDGRVLLLNVQTLGEDGGWAAGEEASRPVTVSWSPKGKHLAIGLLTGEILTFSLTEKSNPHKVIPSTASLPLSSLHWLAPGHTFQTTYASPDDPQCHIVTLDTATSNVSSTSLTYPFPLPDRPQRVLNVLLPNWDFPQGSGSKSLVIFGDVSSTDVEVFGHADKWDQKSRDDADISLPLDKNSDDTFLVGLDVDLTSSTPAPSVLASGEAIDWPPAPILFAYLNDGTIQAWHVTQATPYVGMIAPSGVPPVSSPAMLDIPGAGVGAPSAPEQDMLTPSQTVNPKTETVDMSEAMMTTNTSMGMGMGMGEEPSSVMGFSRVVFRRKVSNLSLTVVEMSGSAVGPTSTPAPPQQANTSAFGQTSGFGQPSVISKPLFGQGSFGQGSFGQSNTSASTSNTNTNPISGGFGAFASGQSSFGFGNTSAPNITKAPSSDSIPSDDMQAETTPEPSNSNSNSEPKLAFGGLSFGGPPPAQEEDKDKGKPVVNSMFGSATAFGAPSTFGGSSAFGGGSGGGGLIKPATAFGASSATTASSTGPSETPSSLFSAPAKPANTSSAFGQSSFGQSPLGQPSAFGQSSFGNPSAFGQSSFGQPSTFGQSSFGHSAFGKPAFGASSFPAKAPTAPSAATTAPAPASGGGFASFARSNVTFGKPSIPVTGNATPSTPAPSAPASGGGFASFAQSTATFGKPSTTTTGSATPSTPTPSVFSPPAKGVITPSSSPETPMKDTAQTSALSSPDSPVPVKPATTPFSTPSQPSTSSSAFKPASGFGAFGSSTTPSSSPFFKTPSTPASQGAFASLGSPSPSPFSTPTFGASTTPGASPGTKFGVSSALGTPQKSVFGAPSLPTSKPNEGGAFSAFSGGGSAFTSFAGPQKSFKDLLSAGGSAEKTETKPQSVFSPKEEAPKKASPVEEAQPKTPSKPATPSPDDTPQPSGPASPETIRNESKPTSPSDGQSLSSLSFSSTSSSFVEVTKPDGGSPPSDPAGPSQVNDASSDEEGELDNDDGDSFVSESFSSDPEDDNDHENSASESLPSEGESDAEEEDQEEEEEDAQVTEPAYIGLRSPSATPTAEAPSVSFSKSPTPTPNLSLNLDTSTTPPGSPEKQPTLQTPLPAPVPVITLGTSSPTPGLSSGRPSTRPARSSPLAKAPPLSGEPESPSLSKESAEPVKPSTPPIQFKPRPASPKGVFGAPAAKSQVNAPVFSARPMTPPLSTFDTGKSQPSGQVPNPSVAPATPATPGIKLPASFSFSNTTPASSPFGQSSAPSPFGAPAPPAFPSSPSPFGASPLGAPSSGFSGFGTPPQPKQPPAPSAFNPPPPPRQAPTIEDGMQAECMRLFSVLGKELEELKTMSQMATKQREDFAKSSGTHSKADLRTPEKWGGLNDVVPFGKAMKTLESDVKQKKQLMLKEQDFLRDIQDSMLKAGTRKEEIARFNRAKNDADFSQMLKSRTLGPEHHETQVHLRKSIRDIRDRVSKLEQTLQTSKSKLSRSNKGKPVLKPPSLATAHRTLQNIDIAIHQQATEIAGLSSRFARLDISSLGPSNPLLRSRLQYGSKQHAVATPNVAVTTAAALNSERSTHRLKDRLLRTRKEPLLNNKVTPPSHAPLAFSTPRATATSPMPSITFTPPAGGGADFSPGAYSPTPSVRRGAAFASKHYKSPAIKKAPEQQTPSAFAPPAGFSWGPVPSFPPIKPLAAPIIPLKSPHTP